ncbi:unnamed protein product, partial [Meganyctiphanes norvegica]
MASKLECGVCFTRYNIKENRPKSLPCGHTICLSCVQDNLRARQGTMNCPFCRTPCGTGFKTSDDFPTTFALLDLLDSGEQKSTSKSVTPREKEKENLQKKKQAECDITGTQISNCNEHLLRLLHAKETQESAIHSIRLGRTKLLEDYKQEDKRLLEEEEKATSMKHQLDDIVAEGNDIVKGLEAMQDRVKSSNSLLGLNMASQDVQKYYTASQEWVTSRVKDFLKGDTHQTKEGRISLNNVSQGAECRRNFLAGELIYSCLQCRTNTSIVMCGSCHLNSAHLDHQTEIRRSGGNGFCDCGILNMWKGDPTCKKHIKRDISSRQAYDTGLQSTSKCKEVFSKGEKCYICLDCRTRQGIVICGSCFLNSSHLNHRHYVYTLQGDGAFCDCGHKDVWKSADTCKSRLF